MTDDRVVTPAMIRKLARIDFDNGATRELPFGSNALFDYNEEFARLTLQSKYPGFSTRRVELAQVSA